MNFEEYLISKNIDSNSFREGMPQLWEEWKMVFEQMSEASFTSQQLFLINKIRRQFLLKENK